MDDLFENDSNTFKYWEVKREAIIKQIKKVEEDIDLRVLIDCIYKAFLNRIEGKTRWGCKVPYFSAHIKTLVKIFPEAQFIHIIRDGRAVYQSMLECTLMPNIRSFPKSPFVIGWMWLRLTTYAQRDGQPLRKNFLTIQYEHLLADPEKIERQIANFLSEDSNELSKDYFDNIEQNKLLRNDNIEMYVKPNIDSSKANRWKDELTNFQICAFQEMTSKELKKFGYTIEERKLSAVETAKIKVYSRLYLMYQQLRELLKNLANNSI